MSKLCVGITVMNALEMARATLAGIPEEFELGSSWSELAVASPEFLNNHRDAEVALNISLRGRLMSIQAQCGMTTGMPAFSGRFNGTCVIYADGHVWIAEFDIDSATTRLTPLNGVVHMVSPSQASRS